MDVDGGTSIGFNEPIFPLENIKEKTIPVKIPIKDPWGRQLQDQYEIVEKPYMEVELVPGENSNMTMLNMDYEILMPDDTTLQVKLTFKNPEFVSATVPEDQIRITMWGPFYD
jgi:hypothetical protein